MDKNKSKKSDDNYWVDGHERGDGSKVEGHCRRKPNR